MGSNQQFCLRWHNYQSSLLASLPQFLDGDDLTDVTLSAGGRSLRAHRVVLSACSLYFKDLFKALQPVQHPVIVLPGASFTDLCALVTFMYSGEVNIYQDQLRGLLNMADAMQIRGLAEVKGSVHYSSVGHYQCSALFPIAAKSSILATLRLFYSVQIPEEGTPGRLNNKDVSTGKKEPTPKRAKLSPCSSVKQESVFGSQQTDGSTEDLERGEEQVVIKTEDGGTLKTDIESVESKVRQGELSPSSEDSLGGLCGLEAMERMPTEHLTNFKLSPTRNTTSKLFATCLVCGKQLSNQYNLRVHMETHQNLNYACRVCSHVSRSRDALRKHVSYRHPGEGISPRSLKKNKTLSPGNILVEPGNGLMQP
uniref:Uncharacterized protein n=1 Tax=Timema douglasi TaxID=61478 RepID=A0A7R8VH49_TIMDO|nr:unnamed protein product [Timema douglasi]